MQSAPLDFTFSMSLQVLMRKATKILGLSLQNTYRIAETLASIKFGESLPRTYCLAIIHTLPVHAKSPYFAGLAHKTM